MNKYGSRKFIIAMIAIASADALACLHIIDAAVWGTTVGGVIALYVAGNVSQKAVVKSAESNA